MYNRYRAFSIIELMVAMVIIGLLTALATANYLTAQRHARDSVRKAQVNGIATAVESFYTATQHFPGKAPGSAPAGSNGDNCELAEASGNGSTDPKYFVYFYYPFDQLGGTPCYDSSRQGPNYTPSDYLPFPSWIPGLGNYLSTIPTEPRYQGSSDNNNTFEDPLISPTVNQTRTLVYRKLDNGYAVYAVLESNNDAEALKSVSNLNTNPLLPGNITLSDISSDANLYLIRK